LTPLVASERSARPVVSVSSVSAHRFDLLGGALLGPWTEGKGDARYACPGWACASGRTWTIAAGYLSSSVWNKRLPGSADWSAPTTR